MNNKDTALIWEAYNTRYGDWESDSIETKLDRLRELLPEEIDLIDALWMDIRDAIDSVKSGAGEAERRNAIAEHLKRQHSS